MGLCNHNDNLHKDAMSFIRPTICQQHKDDKHLDTQKQPKF